MRRRKNRRGVGGGEGATQSGISGVQGQTREGQAASDGLRIGPVSNGSADTPAHRGRLLFAEHQTPHIAKLMAPGREGIDAKRNP